MTIKWPWTIVLAILVVIGGLNLFFLFPGLTILLVICGLIAYAINNRKN